jgi:hypothetical protein
MREDDGSAAGLTGWSGIEADLTSLRQLAAQLRAEVDASLQPRTQEAFTPLAAGAAFGVRSPSADLHSVREKYTDCLSATVDQLVDQIDTSARLAAVVSEIADRYGSADALASATLADLQAAFVAVAQADRARQFGAGASPAGGL